MHQASVYFVIVKSLRMACEDLQEDDRFYVDATRPRQHKKEKAYLITKALSSLL